MDTSHDIVLRVLVASFHHRNGNQIDYATPPFADPDPGQRASGPVVLPDEFAVLVGVSRPSILILTESPLLFRQPFLCIPDGAHAIVDDSGRAEKLPGCEFVYFQIPNPSGKPTFGISCFRQIPASELAAKTEDVTRTMVQKAVVVLTSEPIFGPLAEKLALVTKEYFAQRDFSNTAVIDELFVTLKNNFHSYVSDVDLNMGLNLRDTITLFKGKLLQIFKMILLERRSSKFLPYISLHQIDLLTTPEISGWMFGTSNSIFALQRGANIDMIVNTDTGVVEILNNDLYSAISMTPADRAFIEEENQLDQFTEFEGSETFIRHRFEEYLLSLLVTTKYVLSVDNGVVDKDLLDDFNPAWIDLWMKTSNYGTWAQDSAVNYGDLMASPGHIKRGTGTDPVAAALKGIRETIAPIQTNIGRVLGKAEAGLASAVTNLTSAEQQKAIQETLTQTMSTASKAAENAVHKTKDFAQDFGKVAEQALSNAGKAAEHAAINATKVAQEGFGAVVAGFKDPQVMQVENASKVMENVSTNAKKLWANLGTWGGGLLDSINSLQEEENSGQGELHGAQELDNPTSAIHLDADGGHFVVGDLSSTQNLKFHSDEETADVASGKFV
ncbi:late secretory pathway protein avl9 [Entophlyctis luteolus]|nr:late secretory pathway protein avl9 [Entophlyctis luteolus]